MKKPLRLKLRKRLPYEGSLILVLSLFIFYVSGKYDLLEKIVTFSRAHEEWEVDEIITVFIFLVICLTLSNIRRIFELKRTERELLAKNQSLVKALDEIETLESIIPICSSCKKIRDDGGFWQQVDQYFSNHSNSQFSHSLCPDCVNKMYPDLLDGDIEKKDQ